MAPIRFFQVRVLYSVQYCRYPRPQHTAPTKRRPKRDQARDCTRVRRKSENRIKKKSWKGNATPPSATDAHQTTHQSDCTRRPSTVTCACMPNHEELRRRAESGNADAQCSLASAHEQSRNGKAPDFAEARRLYALAAAQGHRNAQCFLAAMHMVRQRERGLCSSVRRQTSLPCRLPLFFSCPLP